MADQDMDAQKQLTIDVLFKEYDMLREVILNRAKSRMITCGFLIALIGYFTAAADVDVVWRSLWTFTAIIVFAAVWYRFGQLMKEAAIRVAEIETQVNHVVGKKLLVWENRRRHSFFHKYTMLPESRLREQSDAVA